MKNKILLKKKRSAAAKKLTAARARARQLREQATNLEEQLEAVEDEIPAELENQINQVAEDLETVEQEIENLTQQIADLDAELVETGNDDPVEDPEPSSRSGRAPPASRFRCRSNCFGSRAERDSFYERPSVKNFLQRVRSVPASGSSRRVTGADLTIPTDMLDVLRDNLHKYSKLLPHVRLRPVSGKARQNIIGKVPEGVWMEMAGALNNLEFQITDIETDGYKVGGIIPIDNYFLKDSDLALGEEIMFMLSQAIGYALDKGIVFGLGPNSHMPVGIVTRLAQTTEPTYWGEFQGGWTDLHSSNVMQLNLAALEGTAFFVPFLGACAKAKPTFTTDGKIWIMNDATRQDILIRALTFNANAALMSGIENTLPVVSGEIITLEFMPDHMIVGGFGGEYLLVEREGGNFGSHDGPLYIQDKTVFKGTARYDGQPASGEAFVAFTYDNTAPMTKMSFAADHANTAANALVVTSAAGGSGKTKLTVAGTVNPVNTLKAYIGAPASITAGAVPGTGWCEIESGITEVTAATGTGATVVELDADGRVISIGYCAGVTAGT